MSAKVFTEKDKCQKIQIIRLFRLLKVALGAGVMSRVVK